MLKFVCFALPAAWGLQVSTDAEGVREELPRVAAEDEPLPERPLLVPPPDFEDGVSRGSTKHAASFLSINSISYEKISSEYKASAEFQAAAQENARQGAEERRMEAEMSMETDMASDLPWGVGSPRTGDSLVNFHRSGMMALDFPKEVEYSLESGDNIQTFSNAKQDIKLITQVFENVTNGFFLDSNAGDGEMNSNTLLLELMGWRGLMIEPRTYWYIQLWGKMRKGWLFLGSLSPDEKGRKVGFDYDGKVDQLSGHKVHAYPLKTFMKEMGGRKTIDFWNLNNGGFEYEVLNETLMGTGSRIEFGCILVTFDGRRTGRGDKPWVTERSKDDTEDLIFTLLHNNSFSYLGGLDAYWVNHVVPRYHYKDALWCNNNYFERRRIPTPVAVKAAPPPALEHPGNWNGSDWTSIMDAWDEGFSEEAEVKKMVAYIAKSKAAAHASENVAKAHRVTETRLSMANPGFVSLPTVATSAIERDYARP